MLKKVNSKYILQQIMKEYLDEKIYLKLVKYNKNLRRKLNIKKIDYINFSERVIIDLYPRNRLDRGQHPFININENKRQYFHIYFDDNITEENRTYITENDRVNRIRIIIENEIKSFAKLFRFCNCIERINFVKCDNKKITNLDSIFMHCSSLIDINISNLKTDNVTNMGSMFSVCSALTNLNLSNFNTQNVFTMYQMFFACKSLVNLIINGFDTSNITNMDCMFHECINLRNLDIRNFNIAKVNKIDRMFSGCKAELKDSIKQQLPNLQAKAFRD